MTTLKIVLNCLDVVTVHHYSLDRYQYTVIPPECIKSSSSFSEQT